MSPNPLSLSLAVLGVLLSGVALGPDAAVVVAVFVCGLLVGALVTQARPKGGE
jgi:hypothetical protein